jgi:predicted RNA-binding protein (virulence factor B family)
MIKIGQYNTLKAVRETAYGYYLTDGAEQVLLPRKYVPEDLEAGDKIEVFIYLDSEDRPIATTRRPKAVLGETVLLQVKAVTRVGAFLDWGLEKDLLVPFKEQRDKMFNGNSYVVRVLFDDKTGRLYASNRFRSFCKPGHDWSFNPGQEVDLIIGYKTEFGYVAIINNEYQGMIYNKDIYQPLRAGDRMKGYIAKLRPDQKIDVTLRKPGFDGVLDEKPVIIEKLRSSGGFLPINSKSSPEAIKKYFSMSKKVFKQAIGNLYKERQITITDDGIKLNEQ